MPNQPTLIDEAVAAAVKLWAQGQQDKALAKTQALIDQYPSDEQVLLAHTGLLLHKKDFSAVRDLLTPLYTTQTLTPALMANLSIAHRGCGECELAVEVAQQLVEKAPDKPSGWNALGLAWMDSEQWEKAEAAFSQGLTHHPDHPALKHHLNQAQDKLNKPRAHQRWRPTGDLLLHAQSFSKEGNPVAEEAALRQAIEFEPDFFASHGSLGTFLMRHGRIEEAKPHLETAHRLNPQCATTKYFLSLAGGNPTPEPSSEYIEELFDGYAERFDQHLVQDLAYVVPEVLSNHLLQRLASPESAEVLDLGCGTGLVGEHMVHVVKALDGVDLSQNMLDRANERGLYRTLTRGDVRAFLGESTSTWNGIIAADVFVYCGDIEDIIGLCHQRLALGGVIAFSVEAFDGEHFLANPTTGRYQHSKPYLERILMPWFSKIELIDQVLRKNSGQPVKGYLVLAQKD